MRGAWRRTGIWWLAGGVLGLAGSAWIGWRALGEAREAFETDARIAHRLLSQRVVQHDAILATLTLLQGGDSAREGEQRLPAVYPQILGVHRREGSSVWADADLQRADVLSQAKRRPEVARADFTAGHYLLVSATPDMGHVLTIDLKALVPEIDLAASAGEFRASIPLIQNEISARTGLGAFDPKLLAATWGWVSKAMKYPADKVSPEKLVDRSFLPK